MAIKKLNDVESVEALSYDRVFVDNIITRQDMISNDAENPKYTVEITYRMYALASNGDMHFKNVPKSIIITDFYEKAMQKASQGNMSFVTGLTSIQNVVAEVIADEGVGIEVI